MRHFHILLCLVLHGVAQFDECLKALSDSCARLGGAFKVLHTELLSELLTLLEGDLALVLRHITLVTDKDLDDVRICVLGYRLNPRLDLGEGFQLGQIKSYNNAIGPTVECLRNSAEPLLSGRIPHLHGDIRAFSLRLVLAHRELDAECVQVVLVELVLAVAI